MEYSIPVTRTTTCSYYRTYDRDGNLIQIYDGANCFSSITQYNIHNNVSSLLVYHKKTMVPYTSETIARWIKDLNELGFTCTFTPDIDPAVGPEYHQITIKLSDFEYKAHLLSTLMLVRALWETGICTAPNFYFNLVDGQSNPDKFDLLQTAHKSVDILTGVFPANRNHMIVSSYDGTTNVTKEHLWNKYKKSGFKVYDSHYKGLPVGQTYGGVRINQTEMWLGPLKALQNTVANVLGL